jgi:hypothetical protein
MLVQGILTFQPTLMFAGKARAYQDHLKGASLNLPPVLPANVRQGLKALRKINTLAYEEHL